MIRLSPRQSNAAVGRLRDAIGSGGLDELPDADLLERFARYADHPSFEVILRRHGPMVLGVCRRLLANPHNAEDAFQAAFLVLVRKARSVRRGDRLGPWLYGVAYKVATKAQSRVRRHSEATDMIPDPTSAAEVPDWLPVLDAELNALPAKYREPLVLCELQGASRADAAKALRIPEGTLSSRLARGRELLRRRLLKHGTLLPAGGLAALFAAGGPARGAVPAALFTKTSELAAVAVTGAALAGAVPAGPARLTDEVLKGMMLTKLRMTGGAVLAAVMIATGLTGAMSGEDPGQGGKPAAGVPQPGSVGGSNAADTRKDTQGERPAGDGSVGHIQVGPGGDAEDYRAQYKALFTKALRVLAEDFETISSADQYSGRIEARQPLTNRVAAIEIRRSDDGRLAISVRVVQEAAERKHRDIGLERAILQRLDAQTEEQPEKSKTASTATTPAATGPALPDREALQGLWVVEKMDVGKQAEPAAAKEVQQVLAAGKMQILIAGDVWWGLTGGVGGNIFPQLVKLDPSKNPKWIDMGEFVPGTPADLNNKCIYELDGDKLRICMCAANNPTRPAEFTTDDDSPLMVMHLHRGKLPPAAGEKALVGSWQGPPKEFTQVRETPTGGVGGLVSTGPDSRVEILDGFLFVYAPEAGGMGMWAGGKYTVDTTKNPKWIDVELVAPTNDKMTKLYGCYEIADGQLKLAIGTSGKRTTRPLEFKVAPDVLFFNLKAVKEKIEPPSISTVEYAIPTPKAKDLPTPKPTPAPKPKDAPTWDDQVRELMKAGKFAEAENLLDTRLSVLTGIEAAECRLRYGICLVERAKSTELSKAVKLWQDAGDNFRVVIQVVGEHEKAGRTDKHAAWVRTQAEVRLVQVFQQSGKPSEVLTAAEQLRPKYSGTMEELIILSLMHHAYKQSNESDKAHATRVRMKELFEKLKDKPDAFPAKSGEYSREYWEKTWFVEK